MQLRNFIPDIDKNYFSRICINSSNVKKNDIFFAISTSAKSKNILLALEKAKNKKISTILLTGEKINENLKNCDVVIKAPGLETGNIQESHLIIYHSICFMVEKKLIEKGFINYN